MKTTAYNPGADNIPPTRISFDILVKKKFKVLVCDDSRDDHLLTRRMLSRSVGLEQVGAVYSGRELIDYLCGSGQYADRNLHPLPELLLLDMDMPSFGGVEVLQWLQAHPLFQNLRVVVFSGNSSPEIMGTALALGADYFQLKTSDLTTMMEFVHRLELLMAILENRRNRPSNTQTQTQAFMIKNTLQVIDGRAPPATDLIAAAAASGRNFILVLNNESDLENLWAAVGTTNIVPDRLHRWGVLGMAEALTPDDYSLLLALYRDNPVYLVEQLTLNRNVPPKTKPIMLYCELRGIISQHDTVEEAGLALLGYLERFSSARLLPLAGIYEFHENEWRRVKTLSSNYSPA